MATTTNRLSRSEISFARVPASSHPPPPVAAPLAAGAKRVRDAEKENNEPTAHKQPRQDIASTRRPSPKQQEGKRLSSSQQASKFAAKKKPNIPGHQTGDGKGEANKDKAPDQNTTETPAASSPADPTAIPWYQNIGKPALPNGGSNASKVSPYFGGKVSQLGHLNALTHTNSLPARLSLSPSSHHGAGNAYHRNTSSQSPAARRDNRSITPPVRQTTPAVTTARPQLRTASIQSSPPNYQKLDEATPPPRQINHLATSKASTQQRSSGNLWPQEKRQQAKSQERAFTRKRENPFAHYKHDPNDAEGYLESISAQNERQKEESSIIPQEELVALRKNTHSSSFMTRMHRGAGRHAARGRAARGRNNGGRSFSSQRINERDLLAMKADEANVGDFAMRRRISPVRLREQIPASAFTQQTPGYLSDVTDGGPQDFRGSAGMYSNWQQHYPALSQQHHLQPSLGASYYEEAPAQMLQHYPNASQEYFDSFDIDNDEAQQLQYNRPPSVVLANHNNPATQYAEDFSEQYFDPNLHRQDMFGDNMTNEYQYQNNGFNDQREGLVADPRLAPSFPLANRNAGGASHNVFRPIREMERPQTSSKYLLPQADAPHLTQSQYNSMAVGGVQGYQQRMPPSSADDEFGGIFG